MLILAVGDGVWNALIAGVVLLAGKWMMERAADKAADRAEKAADKVALKTDEVAIKTEEVRTTLATDKADINTQLGAIHLLVNSAMAEQLQINEIALGRLAKLPGASKADVQAWEKAKAKLSTHIAKQSTVDKAVADNK
jgi:hypothetical protein